MPAPFSDRILEFTDSAGDELAVYDPVTGITQSVSKSAIQAYINNNLDPINAYVYNFAVRLALNGITTVNNPDGTMKAEALALIGSVSFKGYA